MGFVKGINPGRLNKRVEIWRYADVDTETGAKRAELQKYATVWAELKPTRGTEFLEYYREANALQFKCTMRYQKSLNLTEKDVLVCQGRQFEINAVLNLMEEGKYLEVYCTESRDTRIAEDAPDASDPRKTALCGDGT